MMEAASYQAGGRIDRTDAESIDKALNNSYGNLYSLSYITCDSRSSDNNSWVDLDPVWNFSCYFRVLWHASDAKYKHNKENFKL